MQRKSLFKNFAILSALLLSSCASVPDVPACVEISLNKGACVKIISGETFIVDDDHKFNDQTWWDMRPTMVQLPEQSWAEVKKFIIKICKKTNKCQEQVKSWDRSVETIDANLLNKGN